MASTRGRGAGVLGSVPLDSEPLYVHYATTPRCGRPGRARGGWVNAMTSQASRTPPHGWPRTRIPCPAHLHPELLNLWATPASCLRARAAWSVSAQHHGPASTTRRPSRAWISPSLCGGSDFETAAALCADKLLAEQAEIRGLGRGTAACLLPCGGTTSCWARELPPHGGPEKFEGSLVVTSTPTTGDRLIGNGIV